MPKHEKINVSVWEKPHYYRSVLLAVLGICWVSFPAPIISVSNNNHFEQLPLWSRAGLTLVRTWLRQGELIPPSLTWWYTTETLEQREGALHFMWLWDASPSQRLLISKHHSCLPEHPPNKTKQSKQTPKLCYSRFCDLRFSTPGTTTYSSLAQRKVRHKGSCPRPEAWHMFMIAASPTLEMTLGVMLTATAKAYG